MGVMGSPLSWITFWSLAAWLSSSTLAFSSPDLGCFRLSLGGPGTAAGPVLLLLLLLMLLLLVVTEVTEEVTVVVGTAATGVGPLVPGPVGALSCCWGWPGLGPCTPEALWSGLC